MSNPLGITIEEVATRIHGGIPDEDMTWGQVKVDEAVREIMHRIPDIQQRIADGRIDREYIVDKIAEAFGRVFRVVDDGGMYESESEGDYNYKINVRGASPDIWFTDDDWWDLGWVDPRKSSGVPFTALSKVSNRGGWRVWP